MLQWCGHLPVPLQEGLRGSFSHQIRHALHPHSPTRYMMELQLCSLSRSEVFPVSVWERHLCSAAGASPAWSEHIRARGSPLAWGPAPLLM